jgi:multicomponent Na+:H+ antiporter subunit D
LGLAFISIIFKKAAKWILLAGALANVAMLFLLEQGAVAIGGFGNIVAIHLVLGTHSYAGLALLSILFLAAVVISFGKIGKNSTVLLTALAGMSGMVLTTDLFNLFVFMEITAISAYILSMRGKKPEHSFNYLVLGAVGSVLFLLGTILIYNQTGFLGMRSIQLMIEQQTQIRVHMFLPFFLIFAGMAVEAKIIPFAGWVKGVLGNADGLTGPLFSAVYSAAILFAFGRVVGNVIYTVESIKILIVIIGLLTFAFGEAAAFRQKNIRKILLFSSIGQSGLAVALFALGLYIPAIFVIINNSVGKFIMFTVAGKLNDTYGTDDYTLLKGTFFNNKLIGIAFSISALSLIGLPLFFGFYAKLNALTALFNGGNWFIPVIILGLAIVEGAYFIRLLISLWAPGKEGEYAAAEHAVESKKLFKPVKVVLIFVLSLVILAAGLLPDIAGGFIVQGADTPFSISQLKGGE